ncbi:PEP-CTERM sorting domain-containing protein [Myxococcota bacterium]|nr:PEP-CTERM sorting domain-containing protein [Myxococcota bacterium]
MSAAPVDTPLETCCSRYRVVATVALSTRIFEWSMRGLVLLLWVGAAQPAAAISLLQIDDFQSGTLEGWGQPLMSPNPPYVAPICGPLGCPPSVDQYMMVVGNGMGGPGSKPLVENSAQWSGDYLSAGVDTITMDLNNQFTTDLEIRLAIYSADSNGGTFALSQGVLLPSHWGSLQSWTSVSFPIAPGDWTAVSGGPSGKPTGADIHTALQTVQTLRILHATSPSWQANTTVGQFGVDNITAIPEPSSWVLLGSGMALLVFTGRRRLVSLGRA